MNAAPPVDVLLVASEAAIINPRDCPGCTARIKSGHRNPYCKAHKKCPGCDRWKERIDGFRPRQNFCKKHRASKDEGGALNCADCQAGRKHHNRQTNCVPCDRSRDRARDEGKKPKKRKKKKAKGTKKAKKKAAKKKVAKSKRKAKAKNGRLGKGRKPLTKKRPKWAQRLLRLRMQNGLSQHALAAKVGVPQTTISHWERGKRKPGAEAHKASLKQVIGWALEESQGDDGSDDTPIGSWLKRERGRTGMTIGELASKANVSELILLGMEAGFSASPSARDLRRIERALDTVVPHGIVDLDLRGNYEVKDFDPRANPIPNVKGVYILRDRHFRDRLAYVGSGAQGKSSIAPRVRDHREKLWWINVGMAHYIEIPDPAEALRVEALLIWACRPRHNKRGMPADPYDDE